MSRYQTVLAVIAAAGSYLLDTPYDVGFGAAFCVVHFIGRYGKKNPNRTKKKADKNREETYKYGIEVHCMHALSKQKDEEFHRFAYELRERLKEIPFNIRAGVHIRYSATLLIVRTEPTGTKGVNYQKGSQFKPDFVSIAPVTDNHLVLAQKLLETVGFPSDAAIMGLVRKASSDVAISTLTQIENDSEYHVFKTTDGAIHIQKQLP